MMIDGYLLVPDTPWTNDEIKGVIDQLFQKSRDHKLKVLIKDIEIPTK